LDATYFLFPDFVYPLIWEMPLIEQIAQVCVSCVRTVSQYSQRALALMSTGAPQFGQIVCVISSPSALPAVVVPVVRVSSHS
jgi:hypothetical protein